MPRLLIIYGTTDGHTARIARELAATLSGAGAEVDVVEAASARDTPRPEEYAGVIVAASVHFSRYQQPVGRWLRAHAAGLRSRPSALLSVCLGVLEHDPDTDRELMAIREHLFAHTGWRPTVSRTFAGAILYTRYHWLKRWVMRRMAEKAGGDTDTSRDFDYTDWQEVRAFAREFLAMVQTRQGGRTTPDLVEAGAGI